MRLLLCAAGVMFGVLIYAQAPQGSGKYEDLKPQQKRLVDDWLVRFSKATGSKLKNEQVYEEAYVATRTTFEAVTHALLTTNLTSESGQKLGTALDLVSKVDEVAGKVEGAGGDEQFRLYVQLKPDAYDVLSKSQEFKRSMDNTVYHRGFPICFRSPGIPSIQFSISRDHARADIDVDYRSSKFPAMLVNGHLSSSNSDVQAGNNYNTHSERWQGLGDWWKNFFGLPLRFRDLGDSDGTKVEMPPSPAKLGKGKIEQAMDDFLKTWLVDQRPSVAMAYLSPRSFSCVLAGEKPEDVDRGMTKFRIQRSMQQVNTSLGKVKAVPEVVQPVTLSLPRIQNVKEQRGYTLFEVREDAAVDAECDYRYGIVDPPKDPPEKFGKYYGSAFRFTSAKERASAVYLLWSKEHGLWRIVSFIVEPPGEKAVTVAPVKRVKEEPVKTAGNAEMLKENLAFLEAWLGKGNIQKAMGFVGDSCLSCVGLYSEEGPKKAANPAEARARLSAGLGKIRPVIASGSGWTTQLNPVEISTTGVQVVTHADDKSFTVIGLPDQVMEAVDCRKRTTPDLLPVGHGTPVYGNYYATLIRPKQGTASGATFYLVWGKEGGAWKIVAYHIDVP